MVQIIDDLHIDMLDFSRLAQLSDLTPQQKLTTRRLRDSIAQNTTALSERIWEKNASRSPELNLFQEYKRDRTGRRLKDYRNEIAHTWKSLVRSDDNLRYNPVNHHAWLREILPTLLRASGQYLQQLLNQVPYYVAYEMAHWEQEFRETTEAQEKARQEELRRKELAYCPPPCKCLEADEWKECVCSTAGSPGAAVEEKTPPVEAVRSWDTPAPPLDYEEDVLGESCEEEYESDKERVFDAPLAQVETGPPAARERITNAAAFGVADEAGSLVNSQLSPPPTIPPQEQFAHPQDLHLLPFVAPPQFAGHQFPGAQMHPLFPPSRAMDLFAQVQSFASVPTANVPGLGAPAAIQAPPMRARGVKRKGEKGALDDFLGRLREKGVKLG